ncbi:MAG: hypothetical protein ACREV4_05860 [Gammaproteobacteria bacterium]
MFSGIAIASVQLMLKLRLKNVSFKLQKSRLVVVLVTIGILCLASFAAWIVVYFALADEFDRVVSLGAFLFSLLAAIVSLAIAALLRLMGRGTTKPSLRLRTDLRAKS